MAFYQSWGESDTREENTPTQNELVVYHGNQAVLVTQKGVTYGFLKLLYNAESNNECSAMMGVRPRGQLVSKVISADNAVLDKPEYELVTTTMLPQTYAPGASVTVHPGIIPRQMASIQGFLGQFPSNFLFPPQRTFSQVQPQMQSVNSQSNNQPQQYSQPGLSNEMQEQVETQSAVLPTNEGPLITGLSQIPFSIGEPLETDATTNKFAQQDGQCSQGRTTNSVLYQDLAKLNQSSTAAVINMSFVNSHHRKQLHSNRKNNNKSTKFPFCCEVCHLPFRCKSKFQSHKRKHTEDEPYICSYCGDSFKYHADLSTHREEMHLGCKTFKCKHCVKSFSTRKELTQHTWKHTGVKMYKCGICNKTYTSSGNLALHQQRHEGVKTMQCSFCPEMFGQRSSLERHIRCLHTGERPFVCLLCNKSFPTSSQLASHKKKHSDVKPFKCSECKMCFRQKHVLKRHMKIHTNERPYKCHVCSRKFRNAFNLKCHTRTHVDKASRCMPCPLCDKRVTIGRGLKRHLKLHHNGECPSAVDATPPGKASTLESKKTAIAPRTCSAGGKESNDKCEEASTSDKHPTSGDGSESAKRSDVIRPRGPASKPERVAGKHGGSAKLRQNSTASKPNNAKMFQCKFCKKRFGKNHVLTRHLKVHTSNRPFKCDICRKAFRDACNLEYHKRTHIGKADRRISCPLCKKTVLVGRGVRRHLKLHHSIVCSNEHEAIIAMEAAATTNADRSFQEGHSENKEDKSCLNKEMYNLKAELSQTRSTEPGSVGQEETQIANKSLATQCNETKRDSDRPKRLKCSRIFNSTGVGGEHSLKKINANAGVRKPSELSFEVLASNVLHVEHHKAECNAKDVAQEGWDQVTSHEAAVESTGEGECLNADGLSTTTQKQLSLNTFHDTGIPVFNLDYAKCSLKKMAGSDFRQESIPIVAVGCTDFEPPNGYSYALMPVLLENNLMSGLEAIMSNPVVPNAQLVAKDGQII